MRHRVTLPLQYLRTVWVGRSPGQKRRWRLLIPIFLMLWWVGVVDAVRHVASFAAYPLAVRLLLGLAMGPLGSTWGSLKASGVLVDAAEAPNMAWLVIVPWPPLLLLLALLFVARTSLELERQRLQIAEMQSQRRSHSPAIGGFRRGKGRKKGGYR